MLDGMLWCLRVKGAVCRYDLRLLTHNLSRHVQILKTLQSVYNSYGLNKK